MRSLAAVQFLLIRNLSTGSLKVNPLVQDSRKRALKLFDEELKRQSSLVTRVEKIEVKYDGPPENATLIMNKKISTPFNCAQHISEMLVKRSLVAEVNGELWDMHRPIENDCTLKFLHAKVEDQHYAALVNKTFWRSCSFLLGAAVSAAFKDSVSVTLHSFPSPNVRSGSFVYDVDLSLSDWKPTFDEMRQLSAAFVKLCGQHDKIQRLDVSKSLALEMFSENEHKTKQIPQIAIQSPNGENVTVYRVGDHLDISRGPMIASPQLVGRSAITAVHKLSSTASGGLFRFQGVALPSELYMNHFAFEIIAQRSAQLNPARIPEMDTKAE